MRAHRGGGMNRMTVGIAHQRKAAGQHAAIGECSEQLAVMSHAGVEPLKQRVNCSGRAVG